MANANQINTIVNDSAKASLGKTAITVTDTASLVALGQQVFSTDENKDAFYKALVDRIGRTVIAVREYEKRTRTVMRNEMDWGLIYQKISYKLKDAVENPSWESSTQANPFDVEISTEVMQKLFSALGTWSFEDSIPDYQMFTAFNSQAQMGAFISGIYINMHNSMEIAEENMANLAVNTNMAGVLIKGKPIQKRNLLAEYNALKGTTLTVANCLTDTEWLKFASREIKTALTNMTRMSTLFNADGFNRFTPTDKSVLEVLGLFASATATYLEADTYHKELVSLPNYEEIAYWQGSGTSFAFEDVSKIAIKNVNLATSDNTTGSVEQGGIIAFLHDIDSCASIIYNRRSHSIYNPRAERFNIFEKADKGYAVDLSENAVVFYVADAS